MTQWSARYTQHFASFVLFSSVTHPAFNYGWTIENGENVKYAPNLECTIAQIAISVELQNAFFPSYLSSNIMNNGLGQQVKLQIERSSSTRLFFFANVVQYIEKINIYLSPTPQKTFPSIFFSSKEKQNHYSWFWCEANHRKLCHSCNCINIYLKKWILSVCGAVVVVGG